MTTAPIKSRREEYSEATKLALLAAAREIFTSDGYQKTGVEAIARAARVTRGAFYHHFQDKKALFEALVIALQSEAAATVIVGARRETEPRERVRAGVDAFLAVCIEPTYQRLVIQEAPAVLGAKRCQEISAATVSGLLVNGLAELRKKGRFDFENVELAARLVGSMICEAALALTESERPSQLRRQTNVFVDRIIEALSPGYGETASTSEFAAPSEKLRN